MINKGIARKLGVAGIINRLFEEKSRKAFLNKIDSKYQKTKVKLRSKNKIFVIGFNKTGTTSIEHAMLESNFILGNQAKAELLITDVMGNKFENLYDFIKTAEVFQDIPFSLPNIYKKLYQEYPDAYFILSIRDTPEQWFNSLLKFHTKVYGQGQLPTEEILKQRHLLGYKYLQYTFAGKIYEEDYYKKVYSQHVDEIVKFFAENSGKLCIVNVSEKNDYKKMCEFIGVKPKRTSFEWKNKTAEI